MICIAEWDEKLIISYQSTLQDYLETVENNSRLDPKELENMQSFIKRLCKTLYRINKRVTIEEIGDRVSEMSKNLVMLIGAIEENRISNK
jgi:hypothetical protein